MHRLRRRNIQSGAWWTIPSFEFGVKILTCKLLFHPLDRKDHVSARLLKNTDRDCTINLLYLCLLINTVADLTKVHTRSPTSCTERRVGETALNKCM